MSEVKAEDVDDEEFIETIVTVLEAAERVGVLFVLHDGLVVEAEEIDFIFIAKEIIANMLNHTSD